MKMLYLECNMGAAGDMLMAALYELLEDKEGFLRTMNHLIPGVVVEAGAVVRNCVLFKEAAVRRNASVSYLIADKNVEVLADRTLMGHSSYPIVLSKGSVI